MKKLNIIIYLFCLIITISLAGCDANKKENKEEYNESLTDEEKMESKQDNKNYITLYYKDSDNLLIPITRQVSEITGIGNASLNALKDIPIIREDIGRIDLYPTLPKDLNINGINIKDKIAYVDVNENILHYQSETDEITMIDSLVYTLTQFETVDAVQILINGQKYDTLKFGYPISGPLTRVGINNLQNSANNNLIEFYFVKYLSSQRITCFVPVSIPVKNGITSINDFFTTLEKFNISGYNLQTYIPDNIEVNSFNYEDKKLYLDVPSDNLRLLDCFSEEKAFMQIALSLKSLFEINEIILTVDGQKPKVDDGKSNYTYKVPETTNKM